MLKKNFECKVGSAGRTKEDVDAYNKAVNEISNTRRQKASTRPIKK